MSVMGTGVAAGVAQTALQGQQQAKKRDKKVREQDQTAKHVRDVFEAHIKGLEENEADENTSARLHVDSQLRDHQEPIDDAPQRGANDNAVAGELAGQDEIDPAAIEAQQREIARQMLGALENGVLPHMPTPDHGPNQSSPPSAEASQAEQSDPVSPLYKHLDVKA
ncbi:hypothetical protein [Poriferisphaera sp. WC338]|uniref:hypothetical protein n=1 Tax=Poriferisphaera sp. WC338 TaxID=3425129 RepID=UPI003D815EF5